jgi:hypothetical protein
VPATISGSQRSRWRSSGEASRLSTKWKQRLGDVRVGLGEADDRGKHLAQGCAAAARRPRDPECSDTQPGELPDVVEGMDSLALPVGRVRGDAGQERCQIAGGDLSERG